MIGRFRHRNGTSMEAAIRFGIFLALFAAFALWEAARPRRAPTQSKRRRWAVNLGIVALDALILRFTLGAAAFATAIHAQREGWGLFNALDLPGWVEGVAAVLILDFAVYLQHVATHAWPPLWRLHRVHHADLDLDVSSGLRFHPLEILLSMAYKAALVAALGANPAAVVVFEVLLNGSSIFTHGNIRMPDRIDRALRLIVCTPDMHRVHHSVIPRETDSNYGFFLSVWDRACGTLRADPAKGHEGMTIGLAEYRDQNRLGLVDLLLLPFRRT